MVAIYELDKKDEKIVKNGRCPYCKYGILFDRGEGIKQCEDCGEQYYVTSFGVERRGGVGE